MFSRNEKYGQALHLQYGTSKGGADGVTLNSHFSSKPFWQRVLRFDEPGKSTNTVDVDLSDAASKQATVCDQIVSNAAVNENEIEQTGAKNAFVR